VSQPGDADAVTVAESDAALTELDDLADDLMPGDHTISPGRQLTLSKVKVGATDSASSDPDKHFA